MGTKWYDSNKTILGFPTVKYNDKTTDIDHHTLVCFYGECWIVGPGKYGVIVQNHGKANRITEMLGRSWERQELEEYVFFINSESVALDAVRLLKPIKQKKRQIEKIENFRKNI